MPKTTVYHERHDAIGPTGIGFAFDLEVRDDDGKRTGVLVASKVNREGRRFIDLRFLGLSADDCEALSVRFAEAAKVLRGA